MMYRHLIFVLLVAGFGQDALAKESVRVLSYNVWYGFTKNIPDRRVNYRAWVKAQQPDVVALQELNHYTLENLKQDAGSWGHQHAALLKEKGFPTGITSRWPLTHVVRTLEGFHHGLLRAESNGLIYYVVHLHPSNWEVRHRETDLILKDIATLSVKQRSRVVILGDFNTFSPFDRPRYGKNLVTFFAERDQKMNEKNLKQGQLDYGVMEKFQQAGWIDLVAKRRPPLTKESHFGSFPTQLRVNENHGNERRLDYILVGKEFAATCRSARVIRDAKTEMLSDHLPVLAEFKWPRSPIPIRSHP